MFIPFPEMKITHLYILEKFSKFCHLWPGTLAHICDLSCSGNGVQEQHSSRSAQAKS
jgi:hypothetical protein